YELLRPCAPRRYFRPCVVSLGAFLVLTCCLRTAALAKPPVGATGSQVPCASQDQDHATSYTGHRLVGKQDSSRLIPGVRKAPGFDAKFHFSTRHRWFTCVRLLDPHHTRGT